jgi:GNAT superfamily N-acetyltransferase
MKDAKPDLKSISLRFAGEADIPELIQMINKAYRPEVEALYKRERMDERWMRALLSEGQLLVATHQPTCVGCIHIRQQATSCHIGTMAVLPAYQGIGISRLLLARAEEWARTHQCATIEFVVVNHRTDLIVLYQRMGYRVVGEAPFPYPEETKEPCHFVVFKTPLR